MLHDWLPSTLADAPVALLSTTALMDYLPAMVVTVGAIAGLTAAAVLGQRQREV